jgi:hypothetical protein
MLANTFESMTLQYYMSKHFLKKFTKSKTPNNTQINQIWINDSTQAYWIDHNLIYFAFKLLNYILQFILTFTHHTIENTK